MRTTTSLFIRAALGFGVLLPAHLSAVPALGRTEEAAPAEAPAGAADVLPVVVDVGDSGLDRTALLQAIASELGVDVTSDPVVDALGTLRVQATATAVTMTFINREGREVSRAMELPRDPAARVEVIALLAGNLARDQAGHLLEGMRKTEPKVVTAEPTEEPEPTEKPEPTEQPAPPEQPKEPPPPEVLVEEPAPLPLRLVNLSLWHPIALYPDSQKYCFNVELGVGSGRVGGLRGIGGNLLLLGVDQGVDGAAMSGLLTRTGGRIRGAQVTGIANLGYGNLEGVDGGGIFNLRYGSVVGGQVGGVFNRAYGAVRGGQVAGVFNMTEADVAGLQLAGAFNLAGGSVDGVQIAGAFNRGGGALNGVQLGAGNFAHDVNGAQIGVVNFGHQISGLQLGVVNVADEVDGLPLGLVNVVSRGRTSAVGWFDSSGASNLGVKYLNGSVYTLLAVGFLPSPNRMAGSFAIGAEIPYGPFFLDLDAMYTLTTEFRPDYDDDVNHGRLRAILGWQASPAVAVFAGGGPQVVEELAGEIEYGGHFLAGAQLF